MAVPIIFNTIIVNGQETNATVSIGQNQQDGWSAHSKQNVAIGVFLGLNNTFNNLCWLFDNDVIDSPIFDNDIVPNIQGQAL